MSAISLLSVLAAGCSRQSAAASASSGPPPAPVKVASAELRNLPVEIKAIGNVEAFTTISVKSQIGGIIMRVHFTEGSPVKKGDLLFEIDPRPYQEAIKQIEANLARDNAMLVQAEANLARDTAQERFATAQARRYEDLAKQGIFSKEQSEQVSSDAQAKSESVRADQAAIESARSSIDADRAALDNAKLQLSYCYIYSPVNGRSGNISVKEGNLVKANDVELVSIMQVEPVYVTFTVPEAQLPAVRERMRSGKVPVRAIQKGDASVSDEGLLSFIDNAVDQTTGTIKLKGTFANGNGRLWPGQFVDVVLRLGERPNVVSVPSKAVQIGQQGSYVFVVKPNQTVEMRDVVTGPPSGDNVEVRQGVSAGETVVTEGHIRLAPGSRVRVSS